MAFNVGTITAELEINGTQFIATLQNADDVLGAFGASAREAAGESGGLFQSFIDFKGAFDLLLDGFGLLTDALGSVVSFFADAVEASDEFEANVQSLSAILRLRGVGQFSDELVGAAVALEDVTAASRNTTLEIQRILVSAGAATEDVGRYTEAVLGLAKVNRIDAVSAARQFARSFSGSIGRLSQYVKGVDELSKSTLKAGGALELATEQFGGFLQATANTSEAIEERFVNAFNSLKIAIGDILSPIVDVFFVAGREIFKALEAGIKENSGSLQSTLAGIAQAGVRGLQAIVDFLINLPVHLTRAQVFFGNLKTEIVGAFTEAKITALDFLLTLQSKFADFAGSLGGKLFGFDAKDAEAAKAAAAGTATELGKARAQADLLAVGLAASKENGAKLIAEAQAAADAIRSGADSSSTWAKFVQQVQAALGGANTELQGMVDGVEKVDKSLDGLNDSTTTLASRLRELRERNGIKGAEEAVEELRESILKTNGAARETVQAVQQVGAAASETGGAFGDWVHSISSANAALSQTARAASGGGGGGGGGFLDSAMAIDPRSGGTRSLGLATSSQTQAYLSSLGANMAGLSDIYGSRTAAGQYYNQVAAFLRGQIQEETQAFTQGIIDELNRQGIFDPTQRNAFISQRFDEARRLGTLPRGASFNSATGSFGSYG